MQIDTSLIGLGVTCYWKAEVKQKNGFYPGHIDDWHFYTGLYLQSLLRSTLGNPLDMHTDYLVGTIIAAGLTAYLFFSLLYPEKF